MSPRSTDSEPDAKEEARLLRRAEAQQRYRDKHLTATRTKARQRMARLRAAARASPEATAAAAEHRRVIDADYRERCRKKKFIAKFGERALIQHYLPLHETHGPYILGKTWLWASEKAPRRGRKKSKKSKRS
ncbi:hypothetical protein B0H16DRAFT_1739423 [Mycena metata]|uniref:Uncharacterized protein n=1 Tax=Mycena metata TaxID=1033252 RepID=A0AAD7HGN3_9AGAR|nr:hypothetical protein B0H16DRAFT_1739423 [Mycena metata]